MPENKDRDPIQEKLEIEAQNLRKVVLDKLAQHGQTERMSRRYKAQAVLAYLKDEQTQTYYGLHLHNSRLVEGKLYDDATFDESLLTPITDTSDLRIHISELTPSEESGYHVKSENITLIGNASQLNLDRPPQQPQISADLLAKMSERIARANAIPKAEYTSLNSY